MPPCRGATSRSSAPSRSWPSSLRESRRCGHSIARRSRRCVTSDARAMAIEVREAQAILRPMTTLVHVVEDDRDLRRLLLQGLSEEGFEVVGSDGAESALRVHGERRADIFVIDIGLEDADGRDLCQALRAQGVGAPVLFLTALDA